MCRAPFGMFTVQMPRHPISDTPGLGVRMKAKQYSVSADQLVYDYGSMVSAICRRMMQDEETAREAAQEIWLEVMESLPSFQGRSKFSTWLYTIAYRIAIRYAKKGTVIFYEIFARSFSKRRNGFPG